MNLSHTIQEEQSNSITESNSRRVHQTFTTTENSNYEGNKLKEEMTQISRAVESSISTQLQKEFSSRSTRLNELQVSEQKRKQIETSITKELSAAVLEAFNKVSESTVNSSNSHTSAT